MFCSFRFDSDDAFTHGEALWSGEPEDPATTYLRFIMVDTSVIAKAAENRPGNLPVELVVSVDAADMNHRDTIRLRPHRDTVLIAKLG